ncbi:MAG: hypothetical protein U0Z70_15835 [Thermomicrobiales bacterium]
MTPRALLTAIGGTAIAFAIAIGVASGTVTSQTAPSSASATTVQTTTPAQPAVALYTVAPHDDCPVAL